MRMKERMVRKIAIVGTGPMGIYLLKHLASSEEKLAITLFEASAIAGIGMPYDPALNADYMLCNAFSREIPTLDQTLIEWLKHLPARELSLWELSYHDLTPRAFYPRVLIGEYLQSQFTNLCEKARLAGHIVTVKMQARVDDITENDRSQAVVHYKTASGTKTELFDTVVIATGHSWAGVPQIDGVNLVSPWPYTNITDLRDDNIGVLGSSLSAIDIVVAIGHARGQFEEIGDHISWFPNQGNDALKVTMVSRAGIMPEGDFYYPFPYEPLKFLTEDAVTCLIAAGPEGLLDRTFQLLIKELEAAEPEYFEGLPESSRTFEGFAAGYFSRRSELGGLCAVKRDLAASRETLRRKETIPHRYALLRGHEVFDRILRDLSEEEYGRFLEHLMPVFADCYAAVPHLSLARIVAMYDAGVLDLVATEDGAKFSQTGDKRIEVGTEDGQAHFDVMIDARGQSSASLNTLPFPGLVKSILCSKEPLIEPFDLDFVRDRGPQIFCLALPQILERYPFSQGLVECSNHAKSVADGILRSPKHIDTASNGAHNR